MHDTVIARIFFFFSRASCARKIGYKILYSILRLQAMVVKGHTPLVVNKVITHVHVLCVLHFNVAYLKCKLTL